MITQKKFKGITVIIPTFNDTDNLVRCLEALYLQSYPKNKIEIIIVNNNPKEDLSGLKKRYDDLIILSEKKIGSYAARNKGIQSSTNEVIAFTDSDCIPDREWLKTGIDYFDTHLSCEIVGGKVKKVFLNPKLPTTIELYDLFSFHQQERYVAKYHFAVTANIFVKREVFDRIGNFNKKMKSGGDSEFGNRAWQAGYKICYNDKSLVTHQAIHDINKLLGKMRRITGGKFQRNRMATEPFGNFLWRLISIYFGSILKALEIKNEVSKAMFLKLLILEIVVQTLVFSEYLKLRFGGLTLRGY